VLDSPVHDLYHEQSVSSVAYSQDGTRIVTASGKEARIWDAKTGKALLPLEHGEEVMFASFSPDGAHMATASASGTIKTWDAGGRHERTFGHLGASIGSILYSPDGTRIVTAAKDGSARVWDATAGEEILVLWYDAPLISAVYSPDGTRFVTAAQDGTARVWEDLPLTALVQRAKQRVFRGLTDAECNEFGLSAGVAR
jgi:WD40 repeat protein